MSPDLLKNTHTHTKIDKTKQNKLTLAKKTTTTN